jgi:hypothetical protein
MRFGRRSAVLALAFEDGQLTALLTNGACTPVVSPLAVDPLLDEPHLVGQELRDCLRPLGRLPRRTVVGLPLNRLMVTSVAVPALPEAELAGFLRLQAEREFLLPPEDLAMGASVSTQDDGSRAALLVALPRRHYENLLQALLQAGLRALAVVPATTALANERLAEARLVLGLRSCDLMVTAGGGIVLLRRIAGADSDALPQGAGLEVLPGEVRISLRQLPAGIRAGLKGLAVTGSAPAVAAAVQALQEEAGADPWRPQPEVVATSPARRCCERLGAAGGSGQQLSVAILPVLVPSSRSWLRGWRPRQVAAAVGVLAALLLLGFGLLLRQRWALSTAREQWSAIGPRAEAIGALRKDAKAHAAWLSDQPLSLDVLRAVTLAFPEAGTVWATRFEIKEGGHVTLAGKAASRDAWLPTLDALRQTPGVRELRVSQARSPTDGKSPMTFALSFTWQAPVAAQRPLEGTP